MDEPLAPFRLFWRQLTRKVIDEGRDHANRVDHLALGDRRMNVDPSKCDDRLVRRKGFRFNLPFAGAVERIADDSAKFLEVDMINAVADLFITSEADADRPVRYP